MQIVAGSRSVSQKRTRGIWLNVQWIISRMWRSRIRISATSKNRYKTRSFRDEIVPGYEFGLVYPGDFVVGLWQDEFCGAGWKLHSSHTTYSGNSSLFRTIRWNSERIFGLPEKRTFQDSINMAEMVIIFGHFALEYPQPILPGKTLPKKKLFLKMNHKDNSKALSQGRYPRKFYKTATLITLS